MADEATPSEHQVKLDYTTMAKEKIQMEFSMKSAPVALLWEYLSSTHGLELWFADEVTNSGKTYTFTWSGSSQNAMLLAIRTFTYIRFRWTDDTEKTYFELRIQVSELTDSTNLIVTDFAEPSETDALRNLWQSQVKALKRVIGC